MPSVARRGSLARLPEGKGAGVPQEGVFYPSSDPDSRRTLGPASLILYVFEGVEGFIDILADQEAWELKREQASALDVYHLFMYLDIRNFNKGFLIAKSFTPGAQVAAKRVKRKTQYDYGLGTSRSVPN